MGDFDYNVAKGMVGYYAGLPGSTDSLVLVALEASGLPSDATLRDCATLTAVKAIATEQTTVGRKTLASVTSTVDNTADERVCDFADDMYVAASGNPIGALVVCYKPTSSSADSDIIPLTNHAFAVTPEGEDIALLVSASGFFRQ